MEIIFKRDEVVEINDARIVFRNFAGAAGKFNREGDRSFAVVIPTEEMKDELIEAGWNVRIRPPREEYDDPFMYLPVAVKFNNRGPGAYLVTGDNVQRLTEETIGMLDEIDIISVDLDIRPYDWEVNGNTGRKAYLQAINVRQNSDRFGNQYNAEGAFRD